MRVCSHRRQCNTEATHRRADVQARTVTDSQEKIRLISRSTVYSVSDIKLIRTDTTLDLSQKAEKVWFTKIVPIRICLHTDSGAVVGWDKRRATTRSIGTGTGARLRWSARSVEALASYCIDILLIVLLSYGYPTSIDSFPVRLRGRPTY